jgi:hypothetical protein
MRRTEKAKIPKLMITLSVIPLSVINVTIIKTGRHRDHVQEGRRFASGSTDASTSQRHGQSLERSRT